jgi:hypothetical protein
VKAQRHCFQNKDIEFVSKKMENKFQRNLKRKKTKLLSAQVITAQSFNLAFKNQLLGFLVERRPREICKRRIENDGKVRDSMNILNSVALIYNY